MKKRSFTLLEVMIGMTILGMMIGSFFHILRQNMKMQIRSKELKQIFMQRELFSHRIKMVLSSCETLWIDTHPNAIGPVLRINYEQKKDADFTFCGIMQGMFFLNSNHQLCFVQWTEQKQGRVEVLLDGISGFECDLFDLKTSQWSQKSKEAAMVTMKVSWNQEKVPFFFFLKSSYKPISYSQEPQNP